MPSASLAVEIDDHDRLYLVTTRTKGVYLTARYDAGCSMHCAEDEFS
jgi:uncharacterized pyridoxamine 5'-phosphate oxidase family protein